MAKDNKKASAEATVEALSKTENFFKKYGKALSALLIIVLLAGAAVFGWYKFAYLPEVEEAAEKTAVAENNFIAGDFEFAVNGDGDVMGFNQIIEEYDSKAPESVHLYNGIAELQNGNWELAIEHLKKYEGEEPILKARALACIGHAYVELEQYEKALASFESAANVADNNFAASYLLNAGVVAEKLGKNDKALACYKKIKDQYPQSMEGYDIDKYIGRIENK